MWNFDYQKQKDEFYYKNCDKDNFILFQEKHCIQGMSSNYLVRISDSEPFLINRISFVFFSFIIPVSELFN